ncbi:MAG: PmoA family protein [Bacteroidota bacterium]
MKNISRRQFAQTSMVMAIGATGMIMPRDLVDDTTHPQDLKLAPVQKDDWKHRWNEKQDPQAKGLTGYLNHGNLFVRYDNHPLLNYRAYQTLKYPYFAQLNGPLSGLSLTSESGLPYPHHRGLWLGAEPLDGGDYWGPTPLSIGQILSTDLKLLDSGKDSVQFTDYCKWSRDEAESPFEDRRTLHVQVPNKHIRLLDCEFEITALKDISISHAKHAFFAIRSAPDIAPTYGGTLMNSEGDIGAKGTYGKPARWCTYFGPRFLHPDITEGIAIMDHPDNFGGICPWFTRDYGHLSPQPFNFLKEPFRISKGETLVLKYRIVLYAGTPKEANLDALYEQWI